MLVLGSQKNSNMVNPNKMDRKGTMKTRADVPEGSSATS